MGVVADVSGGRSTPTPDEPVLPYDGRCPHGKLNREFCAPCHPRPPVGDTTRPDNERVLLAQRLFVAMVEARNIDGQKYGEFPYEPIRPEHAWAELFAVAAEAKHWPTDV